MAITNIENNEKFKKLKEQSKDRTIKLVSISALLKRAREKGIKENDVSEEDHSDS